MAVELRGIAYFESLQHLEGRKFSSLESASQLLQALGNPQDQVAAVHVAGTNGKGSVCALIAAMLRSSGYNVGQTCSPHLVSVTERCLINGQPVDEASFSRTIDHVMNVAFSENLTPSYFVLGLVASFVEFASRKLDWIVIEVGLGGLLDATNLIRKPALSLISGISEDHMEILGPSLADVARNKAGIAKPEVPLFVGEVCAEIREVISRVAGERGTRAEFLSEDFVYEAGRDELFFGGVTRPAHLSALSLLGEYQRANALLAIRGAYALGLSEAAVRDGLRRVRWPGRLEFFAESRFCAPILFDVGHNPEGIRSLSSFLASSKYRRIVFLISILARKNWRLMLEETKSLSPQKDVTWLYTDSGYDGTVAPEEMQRYLSQGEVQREPESGLEHAAVRAGSDGLVVVTGSVFLVGRLRPFVCEQGFLTIAPE